MIIKYAVDNAPYTLYRMEFKEFVKDFLEKYSVHDTEVHVLNNALVIYRYNHGWKYIENVWYVLLINVTDASVNRIGRLLIKLMKEY